MSTVRRSTRDLHARVDVAIAEADLAARSECVAGCAYCCEQLVPTTPGEAEVLVEALGALPRKERREILRRGRKNARRVTEQVAPHPSDQQPTRYILARIPCMFLDPASRTCQVYGSRPLPCRSFYSPSRADCRQCHATGQPRPGFEPVPLPEAMKGIEPDPEMGELHQMVVLILDGQER